MAINPMQRKSRNSFLLGMIITLIVCGVIIGGLVFVMMQSKKEEQQAEQERIGLYILTEDVESGHKIDSSSFKRIVMPREFAPSNPQEWLVDESIFEYEDSGKAKEIYATIDIPKGTIMSKSMVYEEKELTRDIRKQQYNMLVLQKDLKVGDYIDIRFIIPTGEDYLVIPRKRVIEVSETTVWLEMSEQETLIMSCAIYENYIMKGSALYTTTYISPGLQGNGNSNDNFVAVTYPVTSSVSNLVKSDPNVVERAIEGLVNERNRINASRELYANTDLSSIEQGVAEQIKKSQEERKKYWDELNGGGY